MANGDDAALIRRIRTLAGQLQGSANPLARDFARFVGAEARSALIHVAGDDGSAAEPSGVPEYPVDRYPTHMTLGYTDAFGVLFWGSPIGWAQVGYENLMRQIGHPLEEMLAEDWDIPVVNTTIDYLLPIRLGDALVVETSVTEVGNRSVKFETRVLDAEGALALRLGRVHVAAQRDGSPAPLPDWLRAMGPARPAGRNS